MHRPWMSGGPQIGDSYHRKGHWVLHPHRSRSQRSPRCQHWPQRGRWREQKEHWWNASCVLVIAVFSNWQRTGPGNSNFPVFKENPQLPTWVRLIFGGFRRIGWIHLFLVPVSMRPANFTMLRSLMLEVLLCPEAPSYFTLSSWALTLLLLLLIFFFIRIWH